MTPARPGDLGANELIRLLNMRPHPEGGHFAETWRSPGEGRAAMTAIYYLLQADQVSAWHRVDAEEVWLWHAGAALALTLSPPDGKGASTALLGPELRAGQRPQKVIPACYWQTAETLGYWTLVSCIVAPGFEFSGLKLAPTHWRPEV